MTKNEYIASQIAAGKTHSQIIADQPMVDVIGSIRGDNLRNVVAILASGLQYRLDTSPDSPIRTALLTAFKYLSLPDYAINLSEPANAALLDSALAEGLVTIQEKNLFIQLATYQKPLYDITKDDFLGTWFELGERPGNLLSFTLKTKAPEATYILIQSRDIFSDDARGDWSHNTALHGVEAARVYRIHVRNESGRQELRWRCEYSLNVEVA